MAAIHLTALQVREALSYNPDTGEFAWRQAGTRRKAGAPAGVVDKSLGYVRIWLYGSARYGHVLAWMSVTGHAPSHPIDHINRDRADNRWSNLRLAIGSTNQVNRVLGERSGRAQARVILGGRTVSLGYFDSKELADAAALGARRLAQKAIGVLTNAQELGASGQLSLVETD